MGDKGRSVTDSDLYQIAVQIMGGGKRREERARRAGGAGGRHGHQAAPDARRSSSWSAATSTRPPTSGRAPWTRRSTPSRRYSATSRRSGSRTTGSRPSPGTRSAVADVTVKVEDDAGHTASGRGMKRDIVVASVEAIVARHQRPAGEEATDTEQDQGPRAEQKPTGPIEGVVDMGSTITEKIVSRAVGRKVKAGELIEALPVDKLYFNEVIGPPAILNFQKDFEDVYTGRREEDEGLRPARGSRSCPTTPSRRAPSWSAPGIKLMADFAKQQSITMYKEGDGIEHTIASEEGFVLPGEIAVATDSHTCTQGALGALAFGIGTTEGENLLATGELYSFTVPETVRFHVDGKSPAGRLPEGPRPARPRD